MSNYHYNYNSEKVARKLIKCVSTAFLLSILQACEEQEHEQISENDRVELQQLIDEVA